MHPGTGLVPIPTTVTIEDLSGGRFGATTTLVLSAANGTAALHVPYSRTVCIGLNADLLDGAQRDEILSVASLQKIQDACNIALHQAGASSDELLNLPELEIAARSRVAAISGPYGESFVSIRQDIDPDLDRSELVALVGGTVANDGTTVNPTKISELVGSPQ